MMRSSLFVKHSRSWLLALATATTLTVSLTTASAAQAQSNASLAATPASGKTAANAAAAEDAARAKRADAALERAYQKEFAYLVAEKAALRRQLADSEAEADRRAKARAADLARLEAALMTTVRAADAAEDKLATLQRQAETIDDATSSVESVRIQAAAAAGLPATASFDDVFAASIAMLRPRALTRIEDGRFFTLEGVEVSGAIVDVGGVARFGIAGQSAGALAPAGGGAWKVWPQSDSRDARAILAGDAPASVHVFLAAKTDAAISPPPEKTVLSIIQAGGSVAWVIAVLGLLAIFLAAARLLVLRVLSRGPRDLDDEVYTLILEGRLNDAEAKVKSAAGSLARVLGSALQHHARPPAERSELVDERLLREQARVDWLSSALVVVAAVAPLLGLLGTVTGMIATFDAITEVGTGDPRTLAGGISEALITTELGLIVAIPTLLLGNFLSGVGERFKRRLEIAALSIQNRLDLVALSSFTSAPRGASAAVSRPATSETVRRVVVGG